MLDYKKLINGIATSTLLFTLLAGTGCSPSEQPTTIVTGTPTPTLEQVVTQTPEANAAQANPTPTAIPFMPTPFPHDEKSEMPLDSRLAFVAQDQDYIQDIWILNGSEVRRMTHDKYTEHDLSWSPDGKKIAYVQDNFFMDEYDVLRVMNVETGESEIVYPAQGEELRNVVWNPEKNIIVFEEDLGGARLNEDNEVIENVRLSSIDLDTYKVSNLVDLTRGTRKIEWISPDKFWFLDMSNWSLYATDISADLASRTYMVSDYVDWFDVSSDRIHMLIVNHNDVQICGYMECENVTEKLDEAPVSSTFRMTYPLISNNRAIIDESQYIVNEIEKKLFLIKTDSYSEFFVRDLLATQGIIPNHDPYLDETSLSIDDNQLLFSVDRDYYEKNYLLSLDGRHLRELDFGREYPLFSNMHSFAWSPVREDLTLVSDEDIKIVDNYKVAQPIPLDGTLVFIAWDVNGRQSVWKLEDGEVEILRKLSVDDNYRIVYEDEREIAVSPSGEEILVVQGEHSDGIDHVAYIMDINDEENKRELIGLWWGIPPDNFDLSGVKTDSFFNHSFEWQPDGDTIAYLMSYYRDRNGDGDYEVNDERQTDLFFLGTKEVILDHVSTYDWSPDGKSLLAIVYDDELVNYDVETGDTETYYIRSGSFDGSEIKYSPNGQQILISARDGFFERLYVADVNKEKSDLDLENITVIEENYSGNGAAWSPDGQQIVYSVLNEEQIDEDQFEFRSELILSNPDGTEKREIHEFNEGFSGNAVEDFYNSHYFSPQFSPDGNTIIFRDFLGPCESLYAINVDGTDFREPFEDSRQFSCFGHNTMTGESINPDYEFIP